MYILELILIFLEEIFLLVFKIKNTIVRNIVLTSLVILILSSITYLLYITILIILSTAPWYIKLLLVGTCIICIYVVFSVLLNGYQEFKQSKKS